MSPSTESPPATSSLTLENLGSLIAQSGRPAETLANLVQIVQKHFQTDVCSVYLIEPDRTTLVLAATVGLRAESIGYVRMRLDEGLAGLVAEELRPIMVENAPQHPRFKYFREAGEDAYRSFMGVPLVDQGVIQGVLVLQTKDTRTFSNTEAEDLAGIARQLGTIVSEARNLGQFIAPMYERIWSLARNLWWSWDAESNTLFNELDPVRWRQVDHNPVALLNEISLEQLEQRAGELVLHSRLNYAYRRMRDYLRSKKTWGETHTGVLKARPVAYFSAEFGLHESLQIYSGGLGVLAGDHIKSASDLGIPLVGIGLFYAQGYFRQRLDLSGWQNEDYVNLDLKQLPLEPLLGQDHRPVVVAVETRTGTIFARVWKAAVGRNTLLRRRSAIDGPVVWRRRSRPHSPGAAAGNWWCSCLESREYSTRRAALERRTQCIRRVGNNSDSDEHRGCWFRRSVATSRQPHVLHDSHASACWTRSILGGFDRRASRLTP
jgi:starch phosphorylase